MTISESVEGIEAQDVIVTGGRKVLPQDVERAAESSLVLRGLVTGCAVVGVPDERGRREILGIHTRGMPLGDRVDLQELARTTYGFVGADMAALVREAAIEAVRRIMPRLNLEERTIPPEVLDTLAVTREDFMEALKRVQPSAMREVMVQVPNVGWDDIGGIGKAIETLKEGIELEDGLAKADFAQVVDTNQGYSLVRLELHEGRKHIVRRMLKEAGFPVQRLVRTKLHTVQLGDMKPGGLRALNSSELTSLYKAVEM